MKAVVLREYDRVRVTQLLTPDRQFDGTEGVRRPPRSGDLASIVHEYLPNDPQAIVAVEKVNARGYTVWLADFSRDELELVSPPPALL